MNHESTELNSLLLLARAVRSFMRNTADTERVFYGLAADRQEYCFTKDFYGLAADRQEYCFTKDFFYYYFFKVYF